MGHTKAILAAAVIAGLANASLAATVAYLRSEEGAVGTTASTAAGITDSAGGDDNFQAFATANAPIYRDTVPAATVPQTGAANTRSLDFVSSDDIYTPTAGPLRTTDFNAFTVEAFVNFDTPTAFQTIIGRDDTGNPGVVAGPQSLFYLQKSSANVFRFEAATEGATMASVAGTTAVVAGTWYHVAVVGDGTNATLYVNGLAEGTVAFAGGLYDPAADTLWTVGRGQFNGAGGDFVDGRIDEVRWSDTALAPSQFLNAVPEPAALGLLGLGALALMGRHRRA